MSLLNKASLIQIPSGYKDGTLYSAKPTNGDGDFTFSRGSNLAATRVNSDGLIEKGRENLLLQSNQFDTTWVTANSSVTSGQSGYDGSSDAWLLDKSGASGRITQTKSVTGIFTFSVYVKKGTTDWILLYKTGTGEGGRFFDLTNGVIGSSISTAPIDSKIESVGNDWYRCSIVGNSATAVVMYVADSDGSVTDTSGNILIQDSQLELGLVATDYIETGASTAQAGILEDMPRLDYSGGATCPSLLLEPQRSNVITQSEYFGAWSKSYAGTGSLPIITVNEAISPEGLQNASKIVLDKGSGQTSGDYAFIQLGTTMTGDATYSIYLKSATSSSYEVALRIVNTITTVTVNSEWQRFDVSATSTTNPTAGIWLRGGYSTSDNAEFYAFAAQVEAGSYPTSYIPTYGGSSVTRGNDTAINYNNANLPTAYPFSLFVELEIISTSGGDGITLSDSTSGSAYFTLQYFNNNYVVMARPNGSISQKISTQTTSVGIHKMVGVFTSTQLELFVDGQSLGTATNSQTFNSNINDLLIGQLRVVSDTGSRNPISKALVFNTELSSDEAIQLTTL